MRTITTAILALLALATVAVQSAQAQQGQLAGTYVATSMVVDGTASGIVFRGDRIIVMDVDVMTGQPISQAVYQYVVSGNTVIAGTGVDSLTLNIVDACTLSAYNLLAQRSITMRRTDCP